MMTYPLGEQCCAHFAVRDRDKIDTKRIYQIPVASLQITATVVVGFPFMEPSQSSQQLDYRVQTLIVG